jgi:hypothetical protein
LPKPAIQTSQSCKSPNAVCISATFPANGLIYSGTDQILPVRSAVAWRRFAVRAMVRRQAVDRNHYSAGSFKPVTDNLSTLRHRFVWPRFCGSHPSTRQRQPKPDSTAKSFFCKTSFQILSLYPGFFSLRQLGSHLYYVGWGFLSKCIQSSYATSWSRTSPSASAIPLISFREEFM